MVGYKWVRFQHFMEAFLKLLWKNRGKTLELPQIEQRLAICKTCDKFSGARCTLCECCIDEVQSLFNKAAYPTERCPDDPPKWLEVINEKSNISLAPALPILSDESGSIELSEGSERLVQEP